MGKRDVSKMNREELLAELKHVQQVLSRIDELGKRSIELERKNYHARKELEKISLPLTADMSLYIVGLGMLGLLIGAFVGSLFLGAVVGLIAGYGVAKTVNDSKHKTELDKMKKKYTEENIKPIEQKLQKAIADNKAYLESEEVANAKISTGEKYFSQEVVTKWIEYIESHRTDSLKETVNLYEEELHRQRIEEKMQEDAAQQSEYLENIQKSSKSTSRTEKLNTLINYGAYRNTKKIRKKLKK